MRGTLILISFIFIAATLVHAPSEERELVGTPHFSLGPLSVGLPRALSGDSPHYLVGVNSLIEDGDFDLRNNYDEAAAGDWDAGSRFRGVELDRHVDRDDRGREAGTHSPFFLLLLALFAWPVAGTMWVEPILIWATCAAGLGAVFLAADQLSERSSGSISRHLLLLALASPLLCYSRDVWTEPWIAAVWMALLRTRSSAARCGLGIVGTLIKYPFAVVPLTLAVISFLRGQRRAGLGLLASSAGAILLILGTVHWLFRDVSDHSSFFHSGIHAGFRLDFSGLAGLLAGPENGLLFFFPILIWTWRTFRERAEVWLPVVTFFLLHASYADWMGGTGFGSRYLVPALPVMMLGLRLSDSSLWFQMASLYSLGWGLTGGFLPGLVYDRTPWGVVAHVCGRLGWK